MKDVLVWQKSSFSEGDDAPNCLEIAASQRTLLLRESEDPGTVMPATVTGLTALIHHLRTPQHPA
ncbi:DUF397 domain-containing protein [Streptomyces blattellae]|uniref:DUF397 domain-containing protein n=1 Tax=Streptomyces blattellae TaxID=2569855 RepID=UPI0012B72718|nr:DUF397 domain-containing protein [Streptomyces blattellae]